MSVTLCSDLVKQAAHLIAFRDERLPLRLERSGQDIAEDLQR